MEKKDGTKIMEKWIKAKMQTDKWKSQGPEDHLLQMYEMLTQNDQEINMEKNHAAGFGAVRCTKAEVTEMIEKNMMGKKLGNCWGYIKVICEGTTTGNEIMKYLCTKDRGNASYSHFLISLHLIHI